MRNSYTKAAYKIIGRFISECLAAPYSKKNLNEAIRTFPAYYSYNRNLIPRYKAAKPWIVHFAFKRLEMLIKPDIHVL